MNGSRDFYDSNIVAQESFNELYTWKEQPTSCDCGEKAEPGDVYCKSCKNTIRAAMRQARREIMRFNNFDRNAAEEAMVDWLERPEKYGEE